MLDNVTLGKISLFGPTGANKSAECQESERMTNFWAEIAPSPHDHMVQIYKDDEVFLDSLEGFVAGGIKAGDGVIVIATPGHLAALEHRLLTRRISVGQVADAGQYLALDARETLARFMVNEPVTGKKDAWPDVERFTALVTDLVSRAGKGSDGQPRRVRAFGEMVALLWAEGKTAATVRLEYLWHDFCCKSGLCLFCAYPRSYFTDNPEASIQEICAAHSRVVNG